MRCKTSTAIFYHHLYGFYGELVLTKYDIGKVIDGVFKYDPLLTFKADLHKISQSQY